MAVVELNGNGRAVVIPDDDGDVVDIRGLVPLCAPTVVSSSPAPPVVPVLAGASPASCAPLSAAQLTRSLRARLKVVRAEIRARKALEREEQQLTRLLKAAKEKPATVRAIRAAG